MASAKRGLAGGGPGRVAVLGGVGLGDSLIEMVLTENAVRSGHSATFFGDGLYGLADWFPGHRLEKTLPEEGCMATLMQFDLVISPLDPPETCNGALRDRWVNYNARETTRGCCRVEHMVAVARDLFGRAEATGENGIQAPAGLQRHRHPARVCLHPTSAEERKNWLPARFLELGRRLEQKGFEVACIMSAREQAAWEPVIGRRFPLHGFATLADCAAFVYESGYFIGNDSGGGHLAANLGIPTLSIHGRKSKARTWRPGWGRVEVVTPPVNLVGGRVRQQYWKYLLPVGVVHRRFLRFVAQVASPADDRLLPS